MGERIHTKFWIGGDVSRPIAKKLCAAIIEEEMCLGDADDPEVNYEPSTAEELLENRIGGVIALSEHQKNYGGCPVLESFCKRHGIPWDKWHTASSEGGSSFYSWRPGMKGELIFWCTEDRELLIPKRSIDDIIGLLEDADDLSTKREDILKQLRSACPQVSVLPAFRVTGGSSDRPLKCFEFAILEPGGRWHGSQWANAQDVEQARKVVLDRLKGVFKRPVAAFVHESAIEEER